MSPLRQDRDRDRDRDRVVLRGATMIGTVAMIRKTRGSPTGRLATTCATLLTRRTVGAPTIGPPFSGTQRVIACRISGTLVQLLLFRVSSRWWSMFRSIVTAAGAAAALSQLHHPDHYSAWRTVAFRILRLSSKPSRISRSMIPTIRARCTRSSQRWSRRSSFISVAITRS